MTGIWRRQSVCFRAGAILVTWVALPLASVANTLELALEPAPAALDAKALAHRSDENMRSDQTFFRGKMTVVSPRLTRPRVNALHYWEDRAAKKSPNRID